MKYIRLFKNDLKCGRIIILWLLFCAAGIFCMCLGYGVAVGKMDKGTIMNVLAYLLAGEEYRRPDRMELPLRWCILYLAGLFLVADFPFQMRKTAGNAQILSLGSQWGWWIEKLAWTMLTLAGYVAAFAITVVGYCVWKGIPLTREMNLEVFFRLHGCVPKESLPENFWTSRLITMPVILLLILAMTQMTFSQFLGPMGGYFIAASQVAASMVYPSAFLIGNQGMALRDIHVTDTGVDSKEGMLVLLFAGAASLAAWNLLVRKRECLPKEREEV